MSTRAIGVGIGIAVIVAILLWPPYGHRLFDLYSEAETLRQAEAYGEAIAKYQQVLQEGAKSPRRFAKDIGNDAPILVRYRIATCYVCWADGQNDTLLYGKAEEIVEELYPRATIHMHREGILYLWGYLLLKQARYEEAHSKLQEFIGAFPESILVEHIWYLLGETYLELGDKRAARQAFQQLLAKFPDTEYKDKPEVQRLLGR